MGLFTIGHSGLDPESHFDAEPSSASHINSPREEGWTDECQDGVF